MYIFYVLWVHALSCAQIAAAEEQTVLLQAQRQAKLEIIGGAAVKKGGAGAVDDRANERALWEQACQMIYRKITRHDFVDPNRTSCCANFFGPVAELYPNIAEDYLSVIESPMDLHSLKVQLDLHALADEREFFEKLVLVFENSVKYNESHTEDDYAMQMVKRCTHLAELCKYYAMELLPLQDDSRQAEGSALTAGDKSTAPSAHDPTTAPGGGSTVSSEKTDKVEPEQGAAKASVTPTDTDNNEISPLRTSEKARYRLRRQLILQASHPGTFLLSFRLSFLSLLFSITLLPFYSLHVSSSVSSGTWKEVFTLLRRLRSRSERDWGLFYNPIDPNVVGNYLVYVRDPVAVEDIEKNLNENLYRNAWQPIEDVRRMLANAKAYNGAHLKDKLSAHVYAAAEMFEKRLEKVLWEEYSIDIVDRMIRSKLTEDSRKQREDDDEEHRMFADATEAKDLSRLREQGWLALAQGAAGGNAQGGVGPDPGGEDGIHPATYVREPGPSQAGFLTKTEWLFFEGVPGLTPLLHIISVAAATRTKAGCTTCAVAAPATDNNGEGAGAVAGVPGNGFDLGIDAPALLRMFKEDQHIDDSDYESCFASDSDQEIEVDNANRAQRKAARAIRRTNWRAARKAAGYTFVKDPDADAKNATKESTPYADASEKAEIAATSTTDATATATTTDSVAAGGQASTVASNTSAPVSNEGSSSSSSSSSSDAANDTNRTTDDKDKDMKLQDPVDPVAAVIEQQRHKIAEENQIRRERANELTELWKETLLECWGRWAESPKNAAGVAAAAAAACRAAATGSSNSSDGGGDAEKFGQLPGLNWKAPLSNPSERYDPEKEKKVITLGMPKKKDTPDNARHNEFESLGDIENRNSDFWRRRYIPEFPGEVRLSNNGIFSFSGVRIQSHTTGVIDGGVARSAWSLTTQCGRALILQILLPYLPEKGRDPGGCAPGIEVHRCLLAWLIGLMVIVFSSFSFLPQIFS
jgi:hypothetical protein